MTNPSFNNFFPENIIAFTSDRSLDFSFENNRSCLSERQIRYLAEQLDMDMPPAVNIRQVHRDRVIPVDQEYLDHALSLEEADGMITSLSGVPLVIRTADCLPVFLYDPDNNCIGLVHSGWQGSRKKIAKKAVQSMQKIYGSKANRIQAAFGPSIGVDHYQVGEEFKDYFPDEIIQKEGAYYLNLVQVNRKQFLDCGLAEENIFDCGICTFTHEECFSYRREGKTAGRMISLIMKK